jgi:phenylacetate-coenzyme A ligase PaaK-like adenylate-forming protein
MASYQELRQRHVAELAAIFPEWVQRLRWPAERLREEQERRLRALLRAALASSPWHRERLAGVDPQTFAEDDLPRLPAMTKDDLMANWDEVVTDRRLNLALVERHLAGLASDAYLFDEVHAIASGGSTGRRGVYVHGWRAWAEEYAGYMRPVLWDRAASPELAGLASTIAMVAAQHATHMTSSMGQTFANPNIQVERFPVTWPIQRIVAGLNAYRAVAILGYPSALALLAEEARAGRLRIAPRRLISTSEPLLPEVRRSVVEAFAAPIANMYGTSEAGPIGVGCWRGPGIHLSDDLVIVEPVDQAGRPMPPGTRSAKIYVTAISNPLLPLIRLELTDQVTFLDRRCPCGSAHRLVADVEARLDDDFRYPGGVVVHPHVFRSVLSREPWIVEYQIRQTPTGAEAMLIGAPGDPDAVGRALEKELAQVGVAGPCVEVRVVDRLEWQAAGKVRRFQPISG